MRSALPLLLLVLTAAVAGLWLLARGDSGGGEGPAGPPGSASASEGPGTRLSTGLGGSAEPSARRELPVPEPPVVAAAPTAPEEADGDPDALLIGRVADLEGAPIPGAQVVAATGWTWARAPLDMEDDGVDGRWQQIARAETDAEGRFSLGEPLAPGPLRLAVRADGHAPRYFEGWHLSAEGLHEVGDLVLEPGVTLAGRVIDRGGAGVAGVSLLQTIERGVGGHTVNVPGRGVLLGVTGEDGTFRVSGLAPGPWRLLLDSPVHQVREEQGRAEAPVLQDGLLFVVDGGDGITGQVVGLPPERASGARVEARATGTERAREDVEVHPRARRAPLVEGRFDVRGLMPGVEYSLALWEEGEGGRHVRSEDAPAVTAVAGSRDVALAVEPRASLTLRVVDAGTQAPVEEFVLFAGVGSGARVRARALVDDAGQAVQRHPGGAVTYAGLQPPEAGGVYDLRVVATGYETLERRGVPIARGEAADLGTVELSPAASGLVRVTDRATGEPLEGARVIAAAQGRGDLLSWMSGRTEADPWSNTELRAARTDAAGLARVGLLPAQPCIVVAAAEGFLPCEPVDLRAAEEGAPPLELALASGGRIDVTVEDLGGAPVVGARVRFARRDSSTPGQPWRGPWETGGATGLDGRVELGPLEPGTWGVQLASPIGSRDLEPVPVEVAEGGRHAAAIRVPPRVTVEGVVTQGRLPLAGADLHLSLPESGGRSGGPDAFLSGGSGRLSGLSSHGGRYRIEDVPVGEYQLLVSHPERYMTQSFDLAVGPEGEVFDVELPLAVLEGTVRFPDGRPAPGLLVDVRSADGRGAARGSGATLVEDEEGRLQPEWGGGQRRVRTDADGRYRIAGVATGVELTVSSSGAFCTPGRLRGLVLAHDELRTGADLEVGEAGRLALRLSGGQGSYRVKLQRRVASGAGVVRWTSVWRDRTRQVDGLAPGTWVAQVLPGRGDGEPVLTREVEVAGGQVRELTLSIP